MRTGQMEGRNDKDKDSWIVRIMTIEQRKGTKYREDSEILHQHPGYWKLQHSSLKTFISKTFILILFCGH